MGITGGFQRGSPRVFTSHSIGDPRSKNSNTGNRNERTKHYLHIKRYLTYINKLGKMLEFGPLPR